MANKWKATYWVTTGLFCLMMFGSATMYFISPEVAQRFVEFGYPSYFRMELGVAKYLGVIALLVPMIPSNVREWAYAGFGITLISAVVTHASIGDPIADTVFPVVPFILLSLSYISRKKINS